MENIEDIEYMNDKGEAVANNYFEGILQLRNPTKEVRKFVKELIERTLRVFVAKEEKVTNGFDLYLSSNRFLVNSGRKLQNKFGGEIKISSKLHTRKRLTSKEVYRVTVLFRRPSFKVGDIVRYKRGKIKVRTISKKVFGMDVDTNKKISVSFKDILD